MTNPRDLIRQLADALEALQKEAMTTPHNQRIVVGGVAHLIPIGNDLLARDGLHAHLLNHARAYLAQSEPTLTVEDCSNMHKHRVNFIAEDSPGQIVLDGCFTREDLIEIANTVPPTEA